MSTTDKPSRYGKVLLSLCLVGSLCILAILLEHTWNAVTGGMLRMPSIHSVVVNALPFILFIAINIYVIFDIIKRLFK